MPCFFLLLRRAAALVCFLSVIAKALSAQNSTQQQIERLSAEFWQWRATEQPFTGDDIPRLERASGFVAHWSAADAAGYEHAIAEWETKWRAVDASAAPVATQVDYRLLGSAIARVPWELEVIPDWRRNPMFYVDQSLGAVYTTVLPPAPVSADRQHELIARLASIPRLLDEGKANLTDMRRPYATIAMDELTGIEQHMSAFREGVHTSAILAPALLASFDRAEAAATRSLIAYREWLRPQLAAMRTDTAAGRDAYLYFLRNVALLPYTPEQLLAIGEQEWQRSVASESLQQAANTGLPETSIYPSIQAQIAEEERQEKFIRRYLLSHGIRRHRRPNRAIAPGPECDQLQKHTAPGRGFLLRHYCPRHPPPLHSRGRSRPLLPARLELAQPRSHSPSLLRLGIERGHRLLRRGDDASRRSLR